MATRWQHLLETISIISNNMTLGKYSVYSKTTSYYYDACSRTMHRCLWSTYVGKYSVYSKTTSYYYDACSRTMHRCLWSTYVGKGVLTYGKDAYISPIVMLRRPKNRYCQFLGINVSSAQIFIDAYRIWPIMMPWAELGIAINLS